MELIQNIKGQLIGQIKSSGITRITKENLVNLINGFKIWTQDNRLLSGEEKDALFIELSSHYVADLNYDTDLVVLERGNSITDNDPSMHTDWDPEATSRFYWRKQREFLMEVLAKRGDKEQAAQIINSIDFETEHILRNMENPLRSKFDSRGLVVGYVQSGKTANFTALISKAADAGYRFIIVLAGIHDELRQQTQIRIDRELSGHNNLNLEGDFVEWNNFEEPRRWYNLTSAGWLDGAETGEFSGKGINKFKDVFLSKERPVIAIIKKNVRIMERLIKWISQSEESDRVNVPVLIIDDEADQASVDGNANKEDTDPAKTNAKIRTIINLFSRTGYVGYTATPFANVFIKHDTEHDELGQDLYPRNFIHSLPEPPGYFGTRRIFYDNLDSYFVKEISDPNLDKKELTDRGNITDDLVSSIYSFLFAIAIRKLRGHQMSPMSMMINVDHRVTKMNRIGEIVTSYMKDILPNHYNKIDLNKALNNYLSDCKILNSKLNLTNSFFNNDIIINEVIKIIKSKEIKVRILNSSNQDKLDYAKEPSMKVIAIGGNKLSRGLTLDGLSITYYLRESKQFDTLLQMGRWFGYRKGYEDLVRIYTSETLWTQYRDLAIVELEFRANIQEMIDDDKKPREFAVGVRQILGLLPTAKNRLGAAVLEDYFGGSQVSVTRLTLEKPEIIDLNMVAVEKLINRINSSGIKYIDKSSNDYPTKLALDVDNNPILDFINEFNIAVDSIGNSLEFQKDQLLKYINKRISKNEFSKWNIGIVSIGKSNDEQLVNLPGGITVRTINRARFKTKPVNGAYNIKAVSSKADRKMDLPTSAINEYDQRDKPLLLLYFINKNSKPQTKNESWREPLYEGIDEALKRNPVSYSIIFPSENGAPGVFKQTI
jgi:hypothetical protein